MAPRYSLTDDYRSAIAEHVDANALQGIDRSVTEAELMEAFRLPRGKTRFTQQQISAAVSWCLGPELQGRRRNIAEAESNGREDQTFTSPDKVTSREKAIGHLVEDVPAEVLAARNYLVLPSQYTDDFDLMAIQHDIPPENIAAYILPDSPHASSRFIRNCAEYEVGDRHVGDMRYLLPKRESDIHGGYVDFFGNYGRKPANVLANIPVPANCDDMRFAINVQSSRESGKVHRLMRTVTALGQHDRYNMHPEEFVRVSRQEKEFDGHFSDARTESINSLMFPTIGKGQEENWVIDTETIRKVLYAGGDHKRYDRGTPFDRIDLLEATLNGVQEHTAGQFRHTMERSGIAVDLPLMFMLAAKAAGNVPVVEQFKTPHQYVSPNGNTPFMTCMATLRTVRSQYEECMESIDFIMKLSERVLQISEETKQGREKKSQISMDKRGLGANATLVVDIDGVEASVNIKNLQRDFEQLLHLCGCTPKVGEEDGEESRRITAENYINQVRHRSLHHAKLNKRGFLLDIQLGTRNPPRGRNDRCPCCSGEKYKNCCKFEAEEILRRKREQN